MSIISDYDSIRARKETLGQPYKEANTDEEIATKLMQCHRWAFFILTGRNINISPWDALLDIDKKYWLAFRAKHKELLGS